MSPTPQYEFLVSNDPHLQAYGSFRGHAIRKALKTTRRSTSGKAKELVTSSSSSSQKTVELGDSLRRRFRLGTKPKAGDRADSKQFVVPSPGQAVIRHTEASVGDSVFCFPDNGGMNAIEIFENNAVDPFESLPIFASSGMDALLRYFILNVVEVHGQRSWFEFALTEAPLMNLTLALSATFWLDVCPTLDPKIRQEGIFRKGEAIKAANSLLRKSQIGDILIASVAKLSHIAGAEGAFIEAEVHLKGLCQLIDYGGGVRNLRKSTTISRAVTWADLQTAAALGRPPLLPLIYELQEVTSPPGLLEEVNIPTLDHLEVLGPCSIALKQVLLLLRQVIFAQKQKVISARDIAIQLNTAETIILHSIETRPVTAGERCSKAMLLAAHVLSHIALRKWSRKGPVARALIGRLMHALAGTPEIDMLTWFTWQEYLPCLLWIIAIGAAAAEGDKDEVSNCFATIFQKAVQSLSLETESDVESSLKLFVWDESFFQPFLHKWWNRV